MIRKELKIEPEEFDKQFLAYARGRDQERGGRTSTNGRRAEVDRRRSRKTKDWDEVIKEGTAIRDCIPTTSKSTASTRLLAEAYLAKGDKTGGHRRAGALREDRRPRSGVAQAAGEAAGRSGRQEGSRAALERLNFIYPMDDERISSLGRFVLDAEQRRTARFANFMRCWRRSRIDPAQAHYDLARAYHAEQTGRAGEGRIAGRAGSRPGFRPAQKLLLELSGIGIPRPQEIENGHHHVNNRDAAVGAGSSEVAHRALPPGAVARS